MEIVRSVILGSRFALFGATYVGPSGQGNKNPSNLNVSRILLPEKGRENLLISILHRFRRPLEQAALNTLGNINREVGYVVMADYREQFGHLLLEFQSINYSKENNRGLLYHA